MNTPAIKKKLKSTRNTVVTIGGVEVTIRPHPGKPTLPMAKLGRVFRKLAAQRPATAPKKLKSA
jgi:hypothetical protein